MIDRKPMVHQADPGANQRLMSTSKRHERIQSPSLEDVRALAEDFQKVSKALSRDLLVRMLTWHIQSWHLVARPATLKVPANYAKSATDAPRARRLRPGTEIVREYCGRASYGDHHSGRDFGGGR